MICNHLFLAMPELDSIAVVLDGAARRRRLARGLRGACAGLLVGSAIWLAVTLLEKFLQLPESLVLGLGMLALAAPWAGFIAGFWRRFTRAETARWMDVKAQLRERMSTALEVAESPAAGTWSDLVIHDAAAHLEELNPKQLVPLSLTRAARWAAVFLILAAGLGFLPEYRSKAHNQKLADEKVIQEAGKLIAALTRRELVQRPPALEQTKQSLESVAELGERLEKASLTRSDALKDLASATEKLKDELKELAKDPALKKLEQAARSPGSRGAETAAGLQKQMDAMQKQLESQAKNPEALDQLQKQMEKIQQAAKDLVSQTGPEADQTRQQLAAALSSFSQSAAAAGVSLPQIDEAIGALAAANADRFLKEIESTLNDLEKLRDMKQKLEAMQAAAEKLGKDLAEQLKQGQAEAAADTLEKLAEKLQAANLSPEQMSQILEEVSNALPEAKEYGKVADLLKQAAQQMKSGDKPNASQSLADAAKELKDLMQQMNDAEAMMAALQNLDQASQCIGQCKGWGQYSGRKSGYNPFGKKGGAGVGTWGEEGGDWMESFDDGTGDIDRSAFNDRDQSGRGQSDRDQADLTDRLSPTKVKGQFSPGGPMPSITLKGVSIKGTSKVQYEEATTAAQSEAQSALSQDKVPRAYQGAVKDYFDDLKK
jgi:hypothetical protein